MRPGILLMLGDWQFWHGKRNDALSTYADLYRELEATDAAKELYRPVFLPHRSRYRRLRGCVRCPTLSKRAAGICW
jgi:hypothetical protein